MSGAEWEELSAVRSSFCGLIARWRLTQSDLRILLGEDASADGGWVILPFRMSAPAEQRMRLILRLDRSISDLMGGEEKVAAWLRAPNSACNGTRPLEAMGEIGIVRALIALAEARCGTAGPGSARHDF